MTNELSQHGTGIIGLQDIHDSTVNVTQILGKSLEYKDLMNQLQTQQKLFARTPEDETQERLEISQEIARLTAQIEQFKADVTRLAQEFNRIEINTDRLRRAKAHFEQGEIAAARAVFDSEREQMQDENNRLVREKERYEQDVLPKLKHSADEFYLRALLESTAYDNPNWLGDTCEYFERSINAFATIENIFHYALFLQNHNQLDQSESHYQRLLTDFAHDFDVYDRPTILINLANMHCDKKKFEQAEAEYSEALATYQKLAQCNQNIYLPYVAMTLNSLGKLYNEEGKLEEAEKVVSKALAIYQFLAAYNSEIYSPYVAETMNNLAILYKANNDFRRAEFLYLRVVKFYQDAAQKNPSVHQTNFAGSLNNLANLYFDKSEFKKAEPKYKKALKIYRSLASINPAMYLPYLGAILSNFAKLCIAREKFTQALLAKEEALIIYRDLARINPIIYLPEMAAILIDIANYHFQFGSNRECSINYTMEAVRILLPIAEGISSRQIYLQAGMCILQGWGLNEEYIQQMLADTRL